MEAEAKPKAMGSEKSTALHTSKCAIFVVSVVLVVVVVIKWICCCCCDQVDLLLLL